MGYAEVAVDAPTQPGRTFSYSFADDADVRVGHAVRVPFGSRQLPGFVFETPDLPAYSETRPIAEVIGPGPLLSPAQIELARWLSQTYRSTLFAAASLMTPPGYRDHVTATYFLLAEPVDSDEPEDVDGEPRQLTMLPGGPAKAVRGLDPAQAAVVDLLRGRDPVPIAEIDKAVGKKPAAGALRKLMRKGVVGKSWTWRKAGVRPKMERRARLLDAGVTAAADEDLRRRSPKQAAVLDAVAAAGGAGLATAEIGKARGLSKSSLDTLVKKGLIAIDEVRVVRDPLAGRDFERTTALTLTPDQERVWGEISGVLDDSSADGAPRVSLLFGITGSGKTEIYLRALDRVALQGRKGIVLVPEISLTPQTIERFAGRFPGRVAVLHSHLKPGEQFDEWRRIREGEFDVVIGARSAIFAPQTDLGLIVLDEEHEWTYKQQEQPPLYHARDAAVRLAEIAGAAVILGSATPSLESFHRAASGVYRLLELPNRIVASGDGDTAGGKGILDAAPLPQVRVVDMRDELKAGVRSVFSRPLASGIEEVLERGEQAILFLNRRGASTFVQCRDCGYAARCKKCDAALIYHAERGYLQCHQCGARTRPLTVCPDCGGERIRMMGLGTERLEAETHRRFPGARTMRWDRDVASSGDAHREIIETFRMGAADILIGTQMLAKGLHVPSVTLVGVVNADIGLHVPDFRAAERVFQIVAQVAGRAGRGPAGGRVVVQTYSPDNYAVAAAALQDYRTFYDEEIARRSELTLPPFARLTRLVYQHENAEAAMNEARRGAESLQHRLDEIGYPGAFLSGPAPAPYERIRGRWRWQILLRMDEPGLALDDLPLADGWRVDVDPVGML